MNNLQAGYVYVIHFDDKFHHAQHYVGCTKNVRSRLIAHAWGYGANILKHQMLQGGEWSLAGLYNCTTAEMRKIERSLKNWNNSKQFCPTCNPERYLRPPGTLPIDVRLLQGMPITSKQCREANTFFIMQKIVRSDEYNFAQFEIDMRKVERPFKEELGFIPNGGTQGITNALKKGNCFASYNDREMAGYCYFSTNPEQVTILQIAVRDEYQRNGIGKALLQSVLDAYPTRITIAKVRNDLPANSFWKCVGMTQTNEQKHITSGSTLNVYRSVPKYLHNVFVGLDSQTPEEM